MITCRLYKIKVKKQKRMSELKEIISLLLKSQVSGIRSHDQSNANMHSPVVGTGKVVAEGRLMLRNPKDPVHHVPLGPNAVRVWVDVAKKLDAFLWRPMSEMNIIEEAISSNVAWPADKTLKGQ